MQTTIAAYTVNGAYLSYEEKENGSIEVGKLADVIVLDHKPFEVLLSEIHRVKVPLTTPNGKPVFSDPSLSRKGKPVR